MCKRLFGQKLLNGQAPDGNHQLWAQQLKFFLHPLRAVLNFETIRYAIAALLAFAGKTATYGSHIDLAAECLFIQSDLLKPREEPFAGCPGKRLTFSSFMDSGRLSAKIYLAENCCMSHYRRAHIRAEATAF